LAFLGLYVHVCKMETLYEAYRMAEENDGAPGIDGVTFEAIEESGVESFLRQIRDELITGAYRPMRARKKEIPKGRGQESPRSFDSGDPRSCGPGGSQAHPGADLRSRFPTGDVWIPAKRTAHQAVNRVAQAIVEEKTRIIDIDLCAYFDNVQHFLLLEKVARWVQDEAVMHLLKMMLEATGE
jgi:RNA-directed DNA polymerase